MSKPKKQRNKIPRGMVYDKTVSEDKRNYEEFVTVLGNGRWVDISPSGVIVAMIKQKDHA